jgi:hypothetical protein
MALTASDIARHPALHEIIRAQSNALLEAYEANPRLASVFATQQRWLMAHAALALHFRRNPDDDRSGFNAARFFDVVRRHKVASRNTADAFVKEMLKYKFARSLAGRNDKRIRAIEPTQASLEALGGWAAVHLTTLDAIDGGRRLAAFQAGTVPLSRLQPPIADGLLTSPAVREPEQTFSLFTWLNNGGVVMDRLIAGIEPAHAEADRIPTGILSIAEMAGWLKLSRTHLALKLREAETLGSIGWEGQRGHSVMWVSRGFRDEYVLAQSVKLAIIDAASEACLRAGA